MVTRDAPSERPLDDWLSSITTGRWWRRTSRTRCCARPAHPAPRERSHEEHRTMNVSVFGLGYVGSVSAASFAADGHAVVGVDVNPDKVASFNDGRSPIVEKGLEE